MKRIEQLQPISKEHHHSLTLGQKAIQTALLNDNKKITELCQKIISEFPCQWQIHFKIEEDAIFTPFENKSNQIASLCDQLRKEHELLTRYYEQMQHGNYSVLHSFGTLLKEHTRTEERQLFPLLEEILTPKELDSILHLSERYRDN